MASRPPLTPPSERSPFTAPTPRWTRRSALQGGAMASIGLLWALKAPFGSRNSTSVTSAYKRAADAAATAPFQTDLQVPPTLLPVSSNGTTDTYRLAIREGLAEILPGQQTPIYGYDGIYPGPTIRARKGRTTVVNVQNQLSFDQNIHLHGGFQPANVDGYPMDLIAPADAFTYTYPNKQEAATLWYHDHTHGISARSIYYGLSGFYLLEDDLTDELDLPRDDYDVPLLIADRMFNADGSLNYVYNLDEGFMGDTILVNGNVSPRMAVRRAIYRLRFLNASNARQYQLQLGNGLPMYQIADDVRLLTKPVLRPSIPLGAAERVEVLVDFRDYKAGTELVLTNTLGSGGTADVMRFDVVGTSTVSGKMPTALRPDDGPLPAPAANRSWLLMFSTEGEPEWQISGAGFDENRIDARPKLGTTETWEFINISHRAHPMHLHGVHFKVIDRSGGPIHDGDRGWQDTYLVNPGEQVTIQPYFNTYTGLYVWHCHMLEHQDRSMMRQMQITE